MGRIDIWLNTKFRQAQKPPQSVLSSGFQKERLARASLRLVAVARVSLPVTAWWIGRLLSKCVHTLHGTLLIERPKDSTPVRKVIRRLDVSRGTHGVGTLGGHG